MYMLREKKLFEYLIRNSDDKRAPAGDIHECGQNAFQAEILSGDEDALA